MDQTREATLYGHLWIYTSYWEDTSLVLDYTLSISATLIARGLLNSLLICTHLFSRETPFFLVPKLPCNCRVTFFLQFRRSSKFVFTSFDESCSVMRVVPNTFFLFKYSIFTYIVLLLSFITGRFIHTNAHILKIN